MKIIMHDLENLNLDNIFIIDYKDINYCRGCFSCWFNNNGKCIYNDKLKDIPNKLLNCDELFIITKNTYGTFSSRIKKILERTIGYVYPYFTIRENEIHHKMKNDKSIDVNYIFYGYINDKDKYLLNKLINRNKLNFNYNVKNIFYLKDTDEVRSKINDIIY